MNDIKGLRDLREYAGHTQETLADAIGVDQATYSRYENSDGKYLKKNITLSQVMKLADFYGLNSLEEVDALLYGRYSDYIKEKSK